MFSDYKEQIVKELSTANNIKDKKNRKKVITSLKSISHFLKQIKSNYSDNGIVIYSGVDNKDNVIFESYIMDYPLKYGFYKCDKIFHTDFLKEFCKKEEKYLIMYLTGTEAFYYEKRLTNFNLLKKISFTRQKRQKKGGQSQARIARLREEKILGFANKAFEYFDIYQKNNDYKMSLIAGNGSIIDLLNNRTNNITVKVSEQKMLFEKCDEVIRKYDKNSETDIINKYMGMMDIEDDTLLYGGLYILDAMSKNLVEEIIIHEDSKYYEIVKKFENKIVIHKGITEGDIFLVNFEGIMGKSYFKIEETN